MSVTAVGVIALLCLGLYVLAHPAMWGPDAQGALRLPGGALAEQMWADLAFTHRSVVHGRLPLWNPWDRGGYAFFGDPQTGMFAPTTWLVVGVAVVLGGAPSWLVTLKVLLCVALAGSGVAVFWLRRGHPRWVAALGTLALLWAPGFDALKDDTALWVVAWSGWVMAAWDWMVEAPDRVRGLWCGVAAAMLFNAGNPPVAFVVALLVVPWGLVRLVAASGLAAALAHRSAAIRSGLAALGTTVSPPSAEYRRSYARALAAAAGVALTVALGLSAGQLWALLSVAPQTSLDVAPAVAVSSSLKGADLWFVFAPPREGEGMHLYPGFLMTAGAIVGVLAARRAEAVTWVVLAAIGVSLAAGESVGVLPSLAKLPGFSTVDSPDRYRIVVWLALVLAGTAGVAAAARLKGEGRWTAALAAGFGVSAWITHGAAFGLASIAAVLGSALLLARLGFSPPHRQPRLGLAMLVALGVDLFVAARPVAEQLRPLPKAGRGPAMLEALGDSDMRALYRVADFSWAGARVGPRLGVREFAGQPPPPAAIRQHELYGLSQRVSNILRASNVAVVGFSGRVSGNELTRDLQSVPRHKSLFRIDGPWPLAFWTDRVALVDKHPEARVWLRMQREPAAVIERPFVPDDFDEDHWGTHLREPSRPPPRYVGAQLSRQEPGVLDLSVEAPRPGLFVVVEAFDPGWRAEVDGAPADVLRANVIFQAIPIEAGAHEIRLRYRPSGLVALWGLWALGTLGVLAWALRRWWRIRAATAVAAGTESSSGAESEAPSS